MGDGMGHAGIVSEAADEAARVRGLGVEETGRRFGLRKMARLDAMCAGGDPDDVGDAADAWIDAVAGDALTDHELYLLVRAAITAAAGHVDALWCIADALMEPLVGRNVAFAARFHGDRRTDAGVQAAFDAMLEDRADCGLPPGWWAITDAPALDLRDADGPALELPTVEAAIVDVRASDPPSGDRR